MENYKIAQQRYQELIALLEKYDHAYYILDAPLISDLDYDRLLKELEGLEYTYPQLRVPYSPTMRVSGGIREGFVRAEHAYPLLSLSNVYSEAEFSDFVQRIGKGLGSSVPAWQFFCETKFDGLSLALYYEQGLFIKAVTRGDGHVGEDVTDNVRLFRSVPLRLRQNISLVVRSEALMTRADFLSLNRRRSEDGLKEFANPRNAAAGTVRQLDGAAVAGRRLLVFAYDILNRAELSLSTQQEANQLLKNLGFKTDMEAGLCVDMASVLDFYHKIREKRSSLPYDIDGIVVKLNQFAGHDLLGVTGKAPRFATAFKYAAEQAETRILNIAVQVGRTGVLTPVAEFMPVVVSGTTVRFASLHNWEEMQAKNILIGDYVKIEKAGEIIPQVVSVLTEKRTGTERELPIPKNCPVCNSQVQKRSGEVAYRCTNNLCPSRRLAALKHFVSRDAFDIRGVGEAVLEQLVDLRLVVNPLDLFRLNIDDFLRLKETKIRMATKLYNSIQSCRNDVELYRYIYALGIPFIGLSSARLLADHFLNWASLSNATREQLLAVDGIGDKMADALLLFFASDEFQHLEALRLELQVSLQESSADIVPLGPFAGENVCFTGSLESLSRAEAQNLVLNLGGKISNTVTKSTSILVCGEKTGSKVQKAEKLGLVILSEAEFLHKCQKMV